MGFGAEFVGTALAGGAAAGVGRKKGAGVACGTL